MIKKWGMFMLLIVFCFSLFACSGEKDNAATEQTKENAEAPLNEALVEQGEKIVKSSCIGCHGVDLKGDMGPNLHGLHLTEEQIIDVLVKGRGSMPPASASGKEKAVAAYLQSIK